MGGDTTLGEMQVSHAIGSVAFALGYVLEQGKPAGIPESPEELGNYGFSLGSCWKKGQPRSLSLVCGFNGSLFKQSINHSSSIAPRTLCNYIRICRCV